MPATKGNMFSYTEEQMKNAIEDVHRGMAAATAAKLHKIPRTTLIYKASGKSPENRVWDQKLFFPRKKSSLYMDVLVVNGIGNFLKRNPSICARVAQNLTSCRASVSKEGIVNWFDKIHQYLLDSNYQDILEESAHVYNADESDFFSQAPSRESVSRKRRQKCFYYVATSAPPLVVFWYERIPQDIAMSMPPHWGVGKSESGWMTGELVFSPWLTAQNIEHPVILFIDGHVSHLNLHTSNFCEDNGIILVALFPNATHLLQHMDVAVFRVLKESWENGFHKWRTKNLSTAETVFPTPLQDGFRKYGLVPWNSEAVDYPKILVKGGNLPVEEISSPA
ncbi:hypothetical protein PR048_032170 [Dryococelus australis]|uniref:DDE-1 domain-containing protein n=1 Tax=Dryococelus australis TaxID=614101 RepID=A0ABQ9G2N3_9NEOP|nr:hypothetical protein PR048_032170 [Dryococelus australis]